MLRHHHGPIETFLLFVLPVLRLLKLHGKCQILGGCAWGSGMLALGCRDQGLGVRVRVSAFKVQGRLCLSLVRRL